MNKTKLLLGALLMAFAVVINAQTPQLTFRFNNLQLVSGSPDSLQFDVQVKCDQEDTWMRDLQVYFEYGPDGFGTNIYNNNRIQHYMIGIMDDPVIAGNPFFPLYGIVNGHGVDNTSTRYAIITESYYPDKFGGEVFNFAGTDYPYNIEMPTSYVDLLRFTIAISDPLHQAGIYFYEDIMNGGQFYTDTLDPAPVQYMDPSLYENDLIDPWLIPTGTVAGTVTEVGTGNPVDNAEIEIGNWTTFSAADGTYSLEVPVGDWDITASKPNYDVYFGPTLTVQENQTTTHDIQMNPITTGILEGVVADALTGNPLPGATVTVDGTYSDVSAADGSYYIPNIPAGTYPVVCDHPDYQPLTAPNIVINLGQITTLDFDLTPLPGSITGTVTDADSGNPIENATVEAVGGSTGSAQTNNQGVYVIDNLTPGSYDVTATKSGYEDLTVTGIDVIAGQQTTGIDFALNPLPIDPPENVMAEYVAPDDVHITWDPPAGQGTPAWIRWDNGTNDDAIGLTSGGTFYVGARFTPSEIGQYDGYYLTKIDFFPYAAGTFILKVWTGANAGTEVHSQNLSGLNIGAWNEITLSSNVMVDGTQELWIGYEVTHAGGDYPAGVDAGPANANYGDMLSLDGTTWESMSIAYGLDYNWNIAGFVTPSKSAPLAVPIVNNKTFTNTGIPVRGNLPPADNPTFLPEIKNKALTGYNVYRDGTAIASNIPDLEYWDNDLAPGTYEYCVSAVYDAGESDQVCDDPVTIPDLSPPVNVVAEQTGVDEVTVDWDAPSKALTGYNVYQDGTLLDFTTETQFIQGGLAPGIYDFCVTAVYDEGESVQVCDTAEVMQPSLDPPENLTYELDPMPDVHLMWDAPGGGGGTEELIYDNGTSSGAYSYQGFSMATHMSPAGPCQVLTLKYYTTTQSGANDFDANVFGWDGSQPGTTIEYTENVVAVNDDWMEVDISAANLTFDGDFVVGFGSLNGTTFLGYDAGLNNGRSWDFDHATSTWASWNEAYLIRAIVQYSDGSVEELKLASDDVVNLNPGNLTARTHSLDKPNPQEPIDAVSKAAKALQGYNIYRNGTEIDFTTDTEYWDMDVSNGDYIYCVTAVYDEGESDEICTPQFVINVGINELEANTSIFPNPASDYLKIVSSVSIEEVRLLNSTGQLLQDRKEVEDGDILLNISTYSPGIYILQLRADDQIYNKRVVIK